MSSEELPNLRIITISIEPGKDVEVNYDGFHFYEAEGALVRAIEHVHRDQDEAEGKFEVEFTAEFPEEEGEDS